MNVTFVQISHPHLSHASSNTTEYTFPMFMGEIIKGYVLEVKDELLVLLLWQDDHFTSDKMNLCEYNL